METVTSGVSVCATLPCYTEDVPEPAHRQRSRPRFARASPPAFQLTDRDIEIVRQVARHRFLRSTHLSVLLEASHKKICNRLTRLFHGGYLDRPRAQLDYFIAGGGSAPIVYALGDMGTRLLRDNSHIAASNLDWTRKNRDAGRVFIKHTLAVADFRVALAIAARSQPAVRLLEDDDVLAIAPANTPTRGNPLLWTARVPIGGASVAIGVIPDHVFVLDPTGHGPRNYLVEIDEETMPVTRYGRDPRSVLAKTSIARKLMAYAAGRAQNLHAAHYGWRNFRVLIVTRTAARASNIRDAIASHPLINAHAALFLVSDRDTLRDPSNLLNCAWRDGRGEMQTLL